MEDTLIITEIYKSVQGESSFAGIPCAFVRLTGCPLRCRWCDTAYAFKGGTARSRASILAEVASLDVPLVELTGGEPLAQAGAVDLLHELAAAGYQVLMETSGSESLRDVPPSTHIIMDLKCPDSGMQDRNDLKNLEYLKKSDEIKFVVASRADFDWMISQIDEFALCRRFKVLVSPAWGLVKPQDLVGWMLEYPLPYRLNLQLHKFIWGPRVKGV